MSNTHIEAKSTNGTKTRVRDTAVTQTPIPNDNGRQANRRHARTATEEKTTNGNVELALASYGLRQHTGLSRNGCCEPRHQTHAIAHAFHLSNTDEHCESRVAECWQRLPCTRRSIGVGPYPDFACNLKTGCLGTLVSETKYATTTTRTMPESCSRQPLPTARRAQRPPSARL